MSADEFFRRKLVFGVEVAAAVEPLELWPIDECEVGDDAVALGEVFAGAEPGFGTFLSCVGGVLVGAALCGVPGVARALLRTPACGLFEPGHIVGLCGSWPRAWAARGNAARPGGRVAKMMELFYTIYSMVTGVHVVNDTRAWFLGGIPDLWVLGPFFGYVWDPFFGTPMPASEASGVSRAVLGWPRAAPRSRWGRAAALGVDCAGGKDALKRAPTARPLGYSIAGTARLAPPGAGQRDRSCFSWDARFGPRRAALRDT